MDPCSSGPPVARTFHEPRPPWIRTITNRRAATCCLALVVALTACRTALDEENWVASMDHAPISDFVTRPFAADFDRTLQAAERALAAAGFDQMQNCPQKWSADNGPYPCSGRHVTRVDDRTSYIYGLKSAGTGRHRFWHGEHVRIFVERTGPNQSTVRVISKYKAQTKLGRKGDYSTIILNAMSKDLN